MDELILSYNTKGPRGADWLPVRERITLERTGCQSDGSRSWFRCPTGGPELTGNGRAKAEKDSKVARDLTAPAATSIVPVAWSRNAV